MAKKKVTLSIDPEIIKAVKRTAITLDTTVSEVAEKLFREWLQEVAPEELETDEKA